MNYTRGGCWCPHCRALAKEKGINLGDQWKPFSKESVIEFWSWARKKADDHAGMRVPWSCNIEWSGRWDGHSKEIHGLFDYAMSDPHGIYDAPYWYKRCRHALANGKAEVAHTWYNKVHGIRAAISTLYACGGHIIVPWDQYTGSLAGDTRYWGKPEEYADLYGFVRAVASYLDGYEDALAVGPKIKDDRYGPTPPMKIESGSGKDTKTRRKSWCGSDSCLLSVGQDQRFGNQTGRRIHRLNNPPGRTLGYSCFESRIAERMEVNPT